ncbi:MAG: peptidylprolyl isomerase [Gammaproteobacteria bacterium]
MRYTQAFAITLAGMMLAVGCTKAETPADDAAKPVATVDGTPISNEVWLLYVKTRHQGKTVDQLTSEERSESLEELIRMYVGAAEAKKQKLDDGEPGARLELVSRSALAEMLFRKQSEGKEPTEEELKAEYDARIAEMPKAEYHARHILVDDEAKAKDLIVQLDKGTKFEALAKEHSSDGSAAEGGDLGWFTAGQMVKPFSDAVQQLEIGKYTATPVKSDFGWHVIRLEETRPTTPPPYDTVKPQLGPMVKQKRFEAHLKELVEKARIERAL